MDFRYQWMLPNQESHRLGASQVKGEGLDTAPPCSSCPKLQLQLFDATSDKIHIDNK